MSWLHLVTVGVAGVASMRAAMKHGDVDEAVRQGVIAGPAAVEVALTGDRTTQLAAIAAAPAVEDRAELLDALANVAEGPDRRTAIPAARAARAIALELSANDLPDDLSVDDVARWRDTWGALARRADRWIEVRVLALDAAALLDARGIGIELAAALADPDPGFRRAAVAVIPVPTPAAMRSALAGAVITDTDAQVALGAAQALCADLVADPPGPILDALGAAGLTRLRALITAPGIPRGMLRDAARCLTADRAPASAAVIRKIRPKLPRAHGAARSPSAPANAE